MGGLIGSELTVPDLRETSPISSLIHFAPFLHKYMMSLAPLLLTLPAFASATLEPLLGIESAREKKGEGGERASLTAIATFSTAPMAGGAVVVQADPWGPSNVFVVTLQSLVNDGLLCPITDPSRPEWIAPRGEPEPRPHDGYIVSFVSFHKRGLGLSADRFMRALPHYYGMELHNFNPNSIA